MAGRGTMMGTLIKGFGAVFQPIGGFEDIFQTNTLYQAGTEVLLIF